MKQLVLVLGVLLVWFLAVVSSSTASAETKPGPNTVFFCSDDGTYCGPSRASLLSGYYPHATGVLGYTSPRPAIGDRATWPQHFKNADYYTARVSKVYHMGVPGGIEDGGDGADDPASWTERFNSPGPEWRAPGLGETLEGKGDVLGQSARQALGQPVSGCLACGKSFGHSRSDRSLR